MPPAFMSAAMHAPAEAPRQYPKQAHGTSRNGAAARRRCPRALPLLAIAMTLGGASLPVAAQPILRESRAFSLLPEWPGALIGSSPIRRPAGPMHLVVAGLPFQLGDPQPHAAALPAAAAWDGALPFYLPGNSGGGPGPRRKPLPYFGLGWTVHLGHNRHLVFNDDAGLMFEGRPGFVGSGRYGPTPLPDTTVQRMEAAAASGRLRWQPVVTASLAYRF